MRNVLTVETISCDACGEKRVVRTRGTMWFRRRRKRKQAFTDKLLSMDADLCESCKRSLKKVIRSWRASLKTRGPSVFVRRGRRRRCR